MMTYYLRDERGFPGACLAMDVQNGNLVFAVAAWNSKRDPEAFSRHMSREIAAERLKTITVKGSKLREEDGVWIARAHGKEGAIIGMQIAKPQGKMLRAVLKTIAGAAGFPQRVRDGARHQLALLQHRDQLEAAAKAVQEQDKPKPQAAQNNN